MPTYEYECTKCGHVFERFQNMNDEPVKRCPLCRCKVRKLLGTGAGIIFKGSGFYETDYRSDSYKQAANKEKEPAKDSSEGTGGSCAKKDDSTSKKKTDKKTAGTNSAA